MKFDHTRFYNIEQYLFEEVGRKFSATGDISGFDFLLILHWKSVRAKTKAVQRLKQIVGGTFDQATRESHMRLAGRPTQRQGWRF
jgi:hypothetical protein